MFTGIKSYGLTKTHAWLVLTCQVLNYSCHVHRSAHANAVLMGSCAQIPHHPSNRKNDPRPSWAGQLGGLLLPSSGRHTASDALRTQDTQISLFEIQCSSYYITRWLKSSNQMGELYEQIHSLCSPLGSQCHWLDYLQCNKNTVKQKSRGVLGWYPTSVNYIASVAYTNTYLWLVCIRIRST